MFDLCCVFGEGIQIQSRIYIMLKRAKHLILSFQEKDDVYMSMFSEQSTQLSNLAIDMAMLIPIGSIVAWSGPTITNSELPKVREICFVI